MLTEEEQELLDEFNDVVMHYAEQGVALSSDAQSSVLEAIVYGDNVDDLLAHYGIKGMKWGRRRTRSQIDNSPDAPEHTRARELHSVAKVAGTRKLTNKDLQELTQRLNLEKQYATLNTNPQSKSAVGKGAGWMASKVLKIGDTAVDEITKAHVRVALTNQGLLPTAGGKPVVKKTAGLVDWAK